MLSCGGGTAIERGTTPFTIPPQSLIRFATAQRYIPSTVFPSVESLRNAVYEAILNIQKNIDACGAQNPFWD